jgi:hypothetical protein
MASPRTAAGGLGEHDARLTTDQGARANQERRAQGEKSVEFGASLSGSAWLAVRKVVVRSGSRLALLQIESAEVLRVPQRWRLLPTAWRLYVALKLVDVYCPETLGVHRTTGVGHGTAAMARSENPQAQESNGQREYAEQHKLCTPVADVSCHRRMMPDSRTLSSCVSNVGGVRSGGSRRKPVLGDPCDVPRWFRAMTPPSLLRRGSSYDSARTEQGAIRTYQRDTPSRASVRGATEPTH